MQTDDIRVFVEVVKRGSFAAVARDREVDPSAISRSVAALEGELGVRLLQRTTRRMSPTEAGMQYFDRVEPLLDELERAHVQAAESNRKPKGVVRLAAPVSFALLNIVPLLPEWAARYPEVSLDLKLTDAALDLVTERIDVAIRLGPIEPSGLVATRLAAMRSRVCASGAYVERVGRPRRPADLASHECLLLDMPGFGSRWRFRNARGGCEVEVSGRVRSSNAMALKECALAGMGVILQAEWIVGRELREGSLIDLFPRHEVTAAEFADPAMWILFPSREYLPLKVRMTVDFLKEKIVF